MEQKRLAWRSVIDLLVTKAQSWGDQICPVTILYLGKCTLIRRNIGGRYQIFDRSPNANFLPYLDKSTKGKFTHIVFFFVQNLIDKWFPMKNMRPFYFRSHCCTICVTNKKFVVFSTSQNQNIIAKKYI